MKKKEGRLPKRITALMSQLDFVFHVQNFDRTVVLKKEDYDNRACDIKTDLEYQRIEISIYPCFFENSLEDQRMYLLHEYCHVLLKPLAQVVSNLQDGKLETKEHRIFAVEQTTSAMANILAALLKGRMRYARKAYADYIDAKKK